MARSAGDQVTTILLDAKISPRAALDGLLPLIYEDLRAIAHSQAAADQSATLCTTVLVHEAYMRLARDGRVTAQGRAYFFAAAAQAMKRIVIEYARRRGRLKRGGDKRFVPLDEKLAASIGAHTEFIDLERGIEQLALHSDRAARVVECRFFAGLTVEDTALALGVTARTVKRDWLFARAWLYQHLRAGTGEGDS